MKNKPITIFEDHQVIVINKPAHWLSVPDRYNQKAPNLYQWLTRKIGEIYPLHRLDKETSGVICFAKNKDVFSEISKLFENRKVQKSYQAIVHGSVQPKEGTIDVPLEFHPSKNLAVPSKKGKPSITLYKVIAEYPGYSYLDIKPLTGRTHQIRIHLKYIGHPLMVDKTYGHHQQFLLSSIKYKYKNKSSERPLLTRTPLHATRLTIPVRSSESEYNWQAPLAKDMKAVLNQLEKLKQK